MNKAVLTWLLRFVLAGVFIAAATPKILDPGGFALAIFRYQALPANSINLLAVYLPWLELVVALGLLFIPRLRTAAAVWIVLMLVVFIGAQGQALARGIDVACGCFSTDPNSKQVGFLGIGLNLLLTVGGIILVKLEKGKKAVGNQ